MTQPIRLRSGEELPVTDTEFDRQRQMLPTGQRLRAVCHAPFSGMDFGPRGQVRLCGCSEKSIAQIQPGVSVLEIWRGEAYRQYRTDHRNYVLDETNCAHCIREFQARILKPEAIWFDRLASNDPFPHYPRKLVFRLNSTCNLACVMCYGETSSRIRKERDHLPLFPSAYHEEFFSEIKTILPHVWHLEFSGGEPLLVREHWRIFEMIRELQLRCPIYINTNATVLRPDILEFLQELPDVTLGVSMDAVGDQSEIRRGVIQEKFLSNIEQLLAIRKERGGHFKVLLSCTEHRKNWFELPALFRYAAVRELPVHISFCIRPHNVTLYTLEDAELAYVHDFLAAQYPLLEADGGLGQYGEAYLKIVRAIAGELEQRQAGKQIEPLTDINRDCDGLLAAPRLGQAPFHAPASVLGELLRMSQLPETTRLRMFRSLHMEVAKLNDPWWLDVWNATRTEGVSGQAAGSAVLRDA
jgi:organic radical activating enzyme